MINWPFSAKHRAQLIFEVEKYLMLNYLIIRSISLVSGEETIYSGFSIEWMNSCILSQ